MGGLAAPGSVRARAAALRTGGRRSAPVLLLHVLLVQRGQRDAFCKDGAFQSDLARIRPFHAPWGRRAGDAVRMVQRERGVVRPLVLFDVPGPSPDPSPAPGAVVD